VNDVAALLTVGHGTHTADDLARLLRSAGVAAVVDVRIAPGSRRFPHFGRSELERWLPDAGISYQWEQRLGGFRKLPPDSPDAALANASFRAYAAHMRGPEFGDAMAGLMAEVRARPTAVMCSESLWWRCHRRLIADHADLVEGVAVRHIMPDGKLASHEPTAGVRVAGADLVYDRPRGAEPLPFPDAGADAHRWE
jgi:uncharacterized protein (DUF488 family)